MKKQPASIVIFVFLVLCCTCLGDNGPWKTPPAKVLENYHFDPNKPIADRVTRAPDFVIDYISKHNAGYLKKGKSKFSPYTPTPAEFAEIKNYINAMPKGFADKIASGLLGIYFISNFKNSGLTHFVNGKDNKRYFFILISSDVLKLSASEWITKKERSCFIPDPSYELDIDIGDGASGFYYIFYHEIMHGYEYTQNIKPGASSFFDARENEAGKQQTDPYWTEYNKPAAKYDFTGRDKIAFYDLGNGPKIKISYAPDIYKKLVASPFASLYGSMNWQEDIAEYAAMYMSAKVLKRPWVLVIKKNGEIIFTMEYPLDRKNVSNRVEFMEEILQ